MSRLLSVVSGVLAVGATCVMPIPFANNTAFAASAQNSSLESQWAAYQSSSSSDNQKVEDTAELYLELPLLNQYNQSLTLPDFLMVGSTPINKYEDGRLTYFFDGEKDMGNNWVTSFNYTATVNSVAVSGNNAAITVTPTATETVEGVSTPSPVNYPFVPHTLELVKVNGQWLISADHFSDEFLKTFGKTPNWKTMIANLPSEAATQNSVKTGYVPLVNKNIGSGATVVSNGDPRLSQATTPTSPSTNTIQPNRVPGGGNGGTFYGESVYDVQYYGGTFTDNTNSTDTTSYNSNFVIFTGNDCTNFVSQVQWYGTGAATNSSTYINAHGLPMTPSGTYPWDADSGGATAAWDNVFTYISDGVANYNSNYIGPQLSAESAIRRNTAEHHSLLRFDGNTNKLISD
ncbi:MAG: amidase domain-containing protein [Bacilli bacterium]